MTEEKRTLIETYLPVEEISEEAKKEKNGRAPTFEMHYWWTRKPLVTARAAVLGALLPEDYDIVSFKKLMALGMEKRSHTYDINDDQRRLLSLDIEKMWGKDKPTILDPFGGGGSIPFEAMRMGANVICNDYNPVAYLIQKATLEYPILYSDKLYKDVEKGIEWIIENTQKEIGSFYPKHNEKSSLGYIWAWSVKCPTCGIETPLVGKWWLAQKNKNIYVDPFIENGKIKYHIDIGKDVPEGTCSNGKGRCLSCGAVISNEIIKNQIYNDEKEILLAVILEGKRKKEYVLPSDQDIIALKNADLKVKSLWDKWVVENLVPLEEIPDDNRGSIWAKPYLQDWHKILNPRQKLLFITLIINIKMYVEILKQEHDMKYVEAVATYLSMLLEKEISRNSRLTYWDSGFEKTGHALASRGISMRWDHSEINPFEKGSGTLLSAKKSILKGLRYSIDKLNIPTSIHIIQKPISQLNEKVDLIITDPPYFDDVIYAELSEVFYVWEHKILGQFDFPEQVPKSEDMSAGGNRNTEIFQRLFNISCRKMHSILDDRGLLVMFFAHSSIDAWDFVLNSLRQSGFQITATWPVHTENTNNPIARGNASIMSSIIIVARKRKSDKSGFIEEIQEEVEQHLKKRLEEFWNYGLRGADMTVSAMGATLDVITQYSEIKSYTGEMNVKDVLELVQKYVSEYVLSKYIKSSSGLDGQTSFYLYSRLSGLDGMPFDTANLVSKSLNVNLKQFETDGLIESIKKGQSKGIRILKYNEREINKKQSLIDVVQYIMIVFERSGISDVIKEMDESPFSREEITNVLEAMLSLPAEDVERKAAQRIVDQMGRYTPSKAGQQSIVDDY